MRATLEWLGMGWGSTSAALFDLAAAPEVTTAYPTHRVIPATAGIQAEHSIGLGSRLRGSDKWAGTTPALICAALMQHNSS